MLDPRHAAQFDHDAWATREILLAARALSDDAWRRTFAVGPGSLERTLAHLIEASFFFASILGRRAYVPPADFEKGSFSADELLELHARAAAELRTAAERALAERGASVTFELPIDSGRHVPLPVALTQMADHGSHHRAQCLWMLREVGAGRGLEVHPLRWAGFDPA